MLISPRGARAVYMSICLDFYHGFSWTLWKLFVYSALDTFWTIDGMLTRTRSLYAVLPISMLLTSRWLSTATATGTNKLSVVRRERSSQHAAERQRRTSLNARDVGEPLGASGEGCRILRALLWTCPPAPPSAERLPPRRRPRTQIYDTPAPVRPRAH